MPATRISTLLHKLKFVIVAASLIIFSLMPPLYLVIRNSPFSYWTTQNIQHLLKNKVVDFVYLNTFAKPVSYFFPNIQGHLFMPFPKKVYKATNKNIDGDYTYEGFGYIMSVGKNPVIPRSYDIKIRLDSGKVETFSFGESALLFISEKTNKINRFYAATTNKIDLLKVGDYVRCVFYSELEESLYFKDAAATEMKEVVILFQIMPYWLRYK